MTAPGQTMVEVRGGTRLRSTLARAHRQISDVRGPLVAAAEPIRRQAAIRAPRLTGRLAASLRVTSTKDSVSIGSPLPYAPVQHWGWPQHGIEGRRFLYDTAGNADVWLSALAKHAQSALNRVEGA